MKTFNKYILEAINKGIKLALDDFDYNDNEEISSKQAIIKNNDSTKKLIYIKKNFVDLGLPSGTLWCKYNIPVNKFTKKFNELCGGYYSWGETELKNKDGYDLNEYHDDLFTWKDYEFSVYHLNKSFTLTKYCDDKSCGENNFIDNKLNLELIDDIAYKYDKRMRIPSLEQFQELIEYTKQKWVKDYEAPYYAAGVMFTSKINEETLFLPAAGYVNGQLQDYCDACKYWTSDLSHDHNPQKAYAFIQYDDDRDGYILTYDRCMGLSIRPVFNKQ